MLPPNQTAKRCMWWLMTLQSICELAVLVASWPSRSMLVSTTPTTRQWPPRPTQAAPTKDTPRALSRAPPPGGPPNARDAVECRRSQAEPGAQAPKHCAPRGDCAVRRQPPPPP